MILDRFANRTALELKLDENALSGVLQEAGAVIKGRAVRCPFCDDKHPSAGIYKPNGDGFRYKCHACGFNGSILDVIARVDGLDVSEVFRRLRGAMLEKIPPKGNDLTSPGGRKVHLPEGIGHKQSHQAQGITSPGGSLPSKIPPRRDQESFSREISLPKQPKVYPDIESLKAAMPYPVQTVFQYTCPTTGKIEMLVFRLKTEDGKTFRQAMPVPGGFVMQAPPKPWSIYNRKRIQTADTIVIVEGEGKVHALHKYGVVATTSPCGALKGEHADWQPLAGKNCILWPDADEPGRGHMAQVEKILQSLEPAPRISMIEPTDLDLQDKEDATDLIAQLEIVCTSKAEVQAAILEALNKAKPRSIACGVGKLIEDTIAGRRVAVKWPWPYIGGLTKALLPGTVTIVCGGVGASKSFMILQTGAYWHRQGIKVVIYELEESRAFHLSRCLAQLSACSDMTDPDWIKDNPEQARAMFAEHEAIIESFGACIYASPDSQATLEQLSQWVEGRAKAGCRIIAIDPVTAAAHTGRALWEEDNAFLHSIKRTAVDYDCSILLITHPVKAVSFADVTQLSGGAAYSRFAQSILWLESHAPKTSKVKTACGTTELEHNRTVHLLKARNGKGQGVKLACTFESESLTLTENGIIIRANTK